MQMLGEVISGMQGSGDEC